MSDRIAIQCPECTGKLSVPSTAAGKRVKCPKCQSVISIPAASVQEAPEEPAPRRATSAPSTRSAPAERPQSSPVPKPRKARRAAPQDDNWAEENSEDSFGNDNWDSYDSYNDAPAAMPPKKKGRASSSRESASRGNGYEAPPSQPRSGSSVNWGVMGTGILMMVGAAVWFVVGLMGDVIFYYPPVLFVLGIISFFKGLFGSE
jgi:phage FluMu protein Com